MIGSIDLFMAHCDGRLSMKSLLDVPNGLRQSSGF